tara:strand:- start:4107 stop:5708 length:1602 start_codon:yes stop_codon:yes gene_type:complete
MKFVILFLSIIFCQSLDVNHNFYDRVLDEFESIEDSNISNKLVVWPLKESKPKNHYNLFKNNNISLSPVLALRYSQSGFEMNSDNPYSILWVSPGIAFSFNKVLVPSLNPIWFNGTLRFHKHSAYGISDDLDMGNTLGTDVVPPIFLYNPDYQYGFYTSVKEPEGNGVDFDESIGFISIMSNNFDLTFGKLKASLGPSSYSNLSLSNNMPVFNQLRFHYNYKDKVYLTFIAGDLYSELLDSTSENYNSNNRLPVLPRRLYNHRIDFNIFENLRLGFYEQVITGVTNFSYVNPFQLYWSEQHQQGDLDNLQMGFDFDYIFSKYRVYGGLLIDEWAPYKTFSKDSRNWFAQQIGVSRIFNFKAGYKNSSGTKKQRKIKGILKFEYSLAEPQVYTHKFPINIPAHHNYPVGLWSGGDSVDQRASFILFINDYNDVNQFTLDIGYHNTRIGEANYDESASLLNPQDIFNETDEEDESKKPVHRAVLKSRNLLYIQAKKTLFYNIDAYFKVGYYRTENLYSEDDFLDFSTSLLYNIKK